MRFYAHSYELADDGVWQLPNWDASAKRYHEHLFRIRPRLPASVQQLMEYMEKHTFHDWEIMEWGHHIEDRTAFLEFYTYGGRLEFDGVREITFPPRDEIGTWGWIVEEFDLVNDGSFVLSVATGDGEIKVVAKEVRMVNFPGFAK